jgi:hypothetical protein
MTTRRIPFEMDYQCEVLHRIVRSWLPPTVLPPQWRLVQRGEDGASYDCRARRLGVIVSCAEELDGRQWIHLSVSHRARIPTWEELVDCKEIFLGQREAYQVLPPRERWVNIHPRVLHLFALHDGGTVLPDFTQGSGSL